MSVTVYRNKKGNIIITSGKDRRVLSLGEAHSLFNSLKDILDPPPIQEIEYVYPPPEPGEFRGVMKFQKSLLYKAHPAPNLKKCYNKVCGTH